MQLKHLHTYFQTKAFIKDKKETTESERERIRRDNLKFLKNKVDGQNSSINRP